MFRRIAIITLLITGCGNPSTSKSVKQEVINRDTSFKKGEGNLTAEADTAYNTTILSYKDSIDHQSSTLKKINKSLDMPSEGGETVLYLSGKDTLKMDVTFYGEMGKSVYVLYLRSSHPVFYVGTSISYREPIYLSKEVKIASTSVDKIILRNDAIVSWFQNGKEVKDKYEEKTKEIRDLYNEIQTLIKE